MLALLREHLLKASDAPKEPVLSHEGRSWTPVSKQTLCFETGVQGFSIQTNRSTGVKYSWPVLWYCAQNHGFSWRLGLRV